MATGNITCHNDNFVGGAITFESSMRSTYEERHPWDSSFSVSSFDSSTASDMSCTHVCNPPSSVVEQEGSITAASAAIVAHESTILQHGNPAAPIQQMTSTRKYDCKVSHPKAQLLQERTPHINNNDVTSEGYMITRETPATPAILAYNSGCQVKDRTYTERCDLAPHESSSVNCKDVHLVQEVSEQKKQTKASAQSNAEHSHAQKKRGGKVAPLKLYQYLQNKERNSNTTCSMQDPQCTSRKHHMQRYNPTVANHVNAVPQSFSFTVQPITPSVNTMSDPAARSGISTNSNGMIMLPMRQYTLTSSDRNANNQELRSSHVRGQTAAVSKHKQHNARPTKKRKKMYSDFVGVTYNKTHAKYQACITHYRKQHYLGRYKLAVDAAKAYDESAKVLKGKGWKINFATEESYRNAKKEEEERYAYSTNQGKQFHQAVTPSPTFELKKAQQTLWTNAPIYGGNVHCVKSFSEVSLNDALSHENKENMQCNLNRGMRMWPQNTDSINGNTAPPPACSRPRLVSSESLVQEAASALMTLTEGL